jgi:hypothetical protein
MYYILGDSAKHTVVICLLPNCCCLSETSRMLKIYRALRGRGACARRDPRGTQERELHAAGVPYDVVGARVTRERCREFVRSVPGIGPPDQSMWTDEELRAYEIMPPRGPGGDC